MLMKSATENASSSERAVVTSIVCIVKVSELFVGREEGYEEGYNRVG